MHSSDNDADGAATAMLAVHPVPLINADISRQTDPNQNPRDEQTEFFLAAYCLTFSDKVLVTKCTYLVVINAVGSRAFADAAPRFLEYTANWLSTFHRLLKRFLFKQSYPDIIY